LKEGKKGLELRRAITLTRVGISHKHKKKGGGRDDSAAKDGAA